MNFVQRLQNGWKLTVSSFKILRANKQLIIFPVLSGTSLLLIIGSFIVASLAVKGWDVDNIGEVRGNMEYYVVLFLFYLVNYFVVVFFNMALVHCTRLYFKGEEVSVRSGLQFSVSRIGAIFSWAVFAATVGLIFKNHPGKYRDNRKDHHRHPWNCVERRHVFCRPCDCLRKRRPSGSL